MMNIKMHSIGYVVILALTITTHSLASANTGESRLTGWDARVFGGYDQIGSTSLKANFLDSSIDVDFDGGSVFGGALGYNWKSGFGAELEYTYHSSDLSTAPSAFFSNATEADIASVMIFTNVLYRFEWARFPSLQPRVGAGVGWIQEVSFDVVQNGAEESFDGDGVAFQFMAGVDWLFYKNWTAGLDLRYFASSSIDLTSESDSGRELTIDGYDGVSALLSFSYSF